MADEVGEICHKWDICYDNELEMNESDFHWTFLKMIIDIFHPPILGQVNI
jgi:hypothetical protein